MCVGSFSSLNRLTSYFKTRLLRCARVVKESHYVIIRLILTQTSTVLFHFLGLRVRVEVPFHHHFLPFSRYRCWVHEIHSYILINCRCCVVNGTADRVVDKASLSAFVKITLMLFMPARLVPILYGFRDKCCNFQHHLWHKSTLDAFSVYSYSSPRIRMFSIMLISK